MGILLATLAFMHYLRPWFHALTPFACLQVKYFYAKGAWSTGMQLTATGYRAGVQVAQHKVTLSSAYHSKIVLPSSWPPIQTLYITAAGGGPGPYAGIPSGQASPRSPPSVVSPYQNAPTKCG